MTITSFDNVWYAKLIAQSHMNTEGQEINVAVDCLGTQILTAACVIAEAIDGLAKAIRETDFTPTEE